MKKTLYDVLQVSSSADPEIIEAAYQWLLQKNQAGGSTDSEKQLKLIQQAYAVLSNTVKKSQYDQLISSQAAKQPEAPFQMSHSQYKSDFSNPYIHWWQSPKITGIIVASVLIIAFGLYINYEREQNKIAMANQAEAMKRQAMELDAENVSKHHKNETAQTQDAIANQNESAETAKMTLDFAEKERQQQINNQRLQAELERQRYESDLAAKQAQQQIELQRQQNFNQLVSEHRYREAAAFAKTTDEISRLDRLVQSENSVPVDKSKTLECQQAQRAYDTAAFKNERNSLLNVKYNLMLIACGMSPPAEVNINRNSN